MSKYVATTSLAPLYYDINIGPSSLFVTHLFRSTELLALPWSPGKTMLEEYFCKAVPVSGARI